ncbi:MAG: outer membrane beta-barrel protein [Cytophagales bacterium]|nr:outer membrane beta-barrel protein [Cytophagales bacterium]
MLSLAKTQKHDFAAIYIRSRHHSRGTIDSRFSLDVGVKRAIQKGKGELFLNATDLLNTIVIRKEIKGNNFPYTSADYYKTLVIRIGYNYKF